MRGTAVAHCALYHNVWLLRLEKKNQPGMNVAVAISHPVAPHHNVTTSYQFAPWHFSFLKVW